MVLKDQCPPPNDRQEPFQIERNDAESITHTVARGLASIKGVPVTELDSLHNHVDTEALNKLYDNKTHLKSRICMKFVVQNYCVEIREGDKVHIFKQRDIA